jgi:sugar lactone lactonase YvrE
MVLALLVVVFKINPLGYLPGLADHAGVAYAGPKGDLDRDGDVDLDDLQIFSQKWLDQDWLDVDWCQWIEDNPKMLKHLDGLYEFIVDYFQCGQPPEPNEPNVPPEDPLAIKNSNRYPTRLAFGPAGFLYVTDAKVGSVFIYDPNLLLIGELKGFEKPLGIAIDPDGLIYVGSNRLNCVEVYDLDGQKVGSIGQGKIKMPNDLAFDAAGNLYVADSLSNIVRVYDPNGKLLQNMLNSPITTMAPGRSMPFMSAIREIQRAGSSICRGTCCARLAAHRSRGA